MGTLYIEQGLSEEAQNIHRALASLIEELEAVDWYSQRAELTPEENLKTILIHNRNEEMEHAAMTLEWLRRSLPPLDQALGKYLFTTAPIRGIEAGKEPPDSVSSGGGDGALGIGSLSKGGKA